METLEADNHQKKENIIKKDDLDEEQTNNSEEVMKKKKLRIIVLIGIIVIILIIIIAIIIVFLNKDDDSSKITHKNAFSVSSEKKVYFAKGNLQYCPKTKKWKFAENSYDFIGDDNSKVNENYDDYIDLFCWGATGYNNITPTDINLDNKCYGNGVKDNEDTPFDFGIALSEQLGEEKWRMLTHFEIHYLLMKRDNAENLFGYGKIGDVKGLFILPDDWSCPDGINFSPSTKKGFTNQYDWYYTNGDSENYNYNKFNDEEWNKMYQAGAIFLPASGFRMGTECEHVEISGHYWTSSHYGEEFANCLCLFEHDLFLEGNFDRSFGLSVRLVRDA